MTTPWTHDALAADLMDARHLAGEIAMERLAMSGGQLDVAAMRLSWSHPLPTGYEVKISRADFLSDIRSEKWRNYLGWVERLFFAVPKGMVERDEVPKQCGLLWRGAHRWTTRQRAPWLPVEPDALRRFCQALLFRHYAAAWDGSQRAHQKVMDAARDAIHGPCKNCGHRFTGHYGYGCAGDSTERYLVPCRCKHFQAAA
ncbi:MAG: MmcB family DNA repair protein [Gemmatimonadales bacterium]